LVWLSRSARHEPTKQGELPLERPNTLGVLLCPLRRPTVIERWSPYEIACFEGAITLVGKNFYEIAKVRACVCARVCVRARMNQTMGIGS
jgi:hypothetical protein